MERSAVVHNKKVASVETLKLKNVELLRELELIRILL